MSSAQQLYEHVGRRIAEVRRERGLTQEKLAERVDRNAGYVARIEQGVRHASLDTLHAIAVVLEVPVSALFPAGDAAKLPAELAKALEGLSREDVVLLAALASRLRDGARPPAKRRKRRSG